MVIRDAEVEDAEVILRLQRTAYTSEAELYNDLTIPPMTQTLEEIWEDFGNQLFLKAVEGGEIIGSVKGYMDGGTCYIGRLIVHPDFQGRGIGTRLMDEIERRFSEAERFELFTGHLSDKALHIYEKRGYEVFKTEPETPDLTVVYLEKKAR